MSGFSFNKYMINPRYNVGLESDYDGNWYLTILGDVVFNAEGEAMFSFTHKENIHYSLITQFVTFLQEHNEDVGLNKVDQEFVAEPNLADKSSFISQKIVLKYDSKRGTASITFIDDNFRINFDVWQQSLVKINAELSPMLSFCIDNQY